MKKNKWFILVLLSLLFFAFDGNSVKAKELLKEKQYTNIFGDVLGVIQIYDDREIVIKYKYGLRKAELYYCQKGNNCDNNLYSTKTIVEANDINDYKNEDQALAVYTYRFSLEKGYEYKIKVKAYIATGKNYTGNENINGSPIITSFQLEAEEYIKISSSNNGDVGDENISGLLDKIVKIVNTVLIPLIYGITGFVLVIKGALLGTQIVKSADDVQLRAEKIHALKWLVIGVGITFAANSVVGVITGFFKNAFK